MIKRNTRRIRRKSNARRKNQKGGVANGLLAATALGFGMGVYASRKFSKGTSSTRPIQARVGPARPYTMTRYGDPVYSGEGGTKKTKKRTKKTKGRTKKRTKGTKKRTKGTKKRTKKRTMKKRQRGGRANVNWHEGSPLSYYGYPKNVTYDAGGTPNGIWGPTQY